MGGVAPLSTASLKLKFGFEDFGDPLISIDIGGDFGKKGKRCGLN